MSDKNYPGDVEEIEVGPEAADAAEKRRRSARVKHSHDLLDRAAARLDGERFSLLDVALLDADDAALLAALDKAADPLRARVKKAVPPASLAERVATSLDVMSRRADKLERPIPTPWGRVNDALRGGFWPGLYTLTSGTGMGKTQWAIQCALSAAEAFRDDHRAACEERARHGRPPPATGPDRVAYVALELGDVDLTARLLGLMAARAGLTSQPGGRWPLKWSDLFYGRSPSALAEVRDRFAPALAALPLDVETADALGWSYLDLRALAERVQPRLLVLDYSQLVSAPSEGGRTRREELRETIGNVAKVARGLARQGMAVLALSSTARGNYAVFRRGKGKDGNGEVLWMEDPGELVGMGKESGDLEFTADVVLALVREPKASDSDEDPRSKRRWREAVERYGPHAAAMNLVVAKGRGFPLSFVGQIFDGGQFLQAEEGADDEEDRS